MTVHSNINRLIAVILGLRGITVTVTGSRTDGKYNYHTLAGFPDNRTEEIRVSANGNLWSDRIPSFHSVAGEQVRYETELALCSGHAGTVRLGKNVTPFVAVTPSIISAQTGERATREIITA
jgi:hypothetical protein